MNKSLHLPDFRSLSLNQKIGQMCLFGFHGTHITQDLHELAGEYHAGNIILFARNVSDAHGLRDLCRDIYRDYSVPPLIAIDQEGGVVTRINKGATVLPGNMAVAATGKPENARIYGSIIGRELRALGVNLNLAPVLDVTVPHNPGIGVRSFSESPEIVSKFGNELILGLKSQSVFATAKHFPGIGSALIDTHLEMPVIDKSMNELERDDIAPFRTAIETGVDCIMTAHAGFSAFDENSPPVPATFSPAVYSGYLRDQLGFKGVIITDDLEMGGATGSMDFQESITQAVLAGADLLTVCSDMNRQKEVFDIITGAVRSGVIPESRIDESVSRIFLLKEKFTEHYHLYFREDIDEVVEEHFNLSQEIITGSVIVHDERGTIPLRLEQGAVLSAVIPNLREITQVEELRASMKESENTIVTGIKKRYGSARIDRYSLPPDDNEIQIAVEHAGHADCTVLFSYNAHLDHRQTEFILTVSKNSKLFILVMLRNPYDASIVPGRTSIAVHAPTVPGITAAVQKLFGDA